MTILLAGALMPRPPVQGTQKTKHCVTRHTGGIGSSGVYSIAFENVKNVSTNCWIY